MHCGKGPDQGRVLLKAFFKRLKVTEADWQGNRGRTKGVRKKAKRSFTIAAGVEYLSSRSSSTLFVRFVHRRETSRTLRNMRTQLVRHDESLDPLCIVRWDLSQKMKRTYGR